MITNYEQARRLKEIGFDEDTLFVFTPYLRAGERIYKLEEGFEAYKEHLKDWNDTFAQFSAPSISDALQWIRDNKRIDCGVYPCGSKGFIDYVFVHFANSDKKESKLAHMTYEQAESALLNELLDYLEGRGR